MSFQGTTSISSYLAKIMRLHLKTVFIYIYTYIKKTDDMADDVGYLKATEFHL